MNDGGFLMPKAIAAKFIDWAQDQPQPLQGERIDIAAEMAKPPRNLQDIISGTMPCSEEFRQRVMEEWRDYFPSSMDKDYGVPTE